MGGQIRVLCVDDDPEVGTLVEEYLGREPDLTVTTATGAAAARRLLARGTVDCVVSDYEMADETGLDLLRTVRDDHGDLPFVLFTGKGSEEIASEAISAGVTDYLQKGGPEQYDLLANRVRNAVEGHRARRRLDETRQKLEELHDCADALIGATDRETVFERALAAAGEVLEFEVRGIYVLEDGVFVPVADSYRPEGDLPTPSDGILGRTYREGRSFLVEDAATNPDADPDRPTYRAAVSVPVGEEAVFQAISERPGAFTETDHDLARLLASHVTSVLERLDREATLRETTDYLEAILEHTTALIYVKDLDGRYRLVNRALADAHGLDREEMVGKTDHDIKDERAARIVRANDREALRRDAPLQVEERAPRGEEVRTYLSLKVPVYGDDGEPTGVCGISTDITERKEREATLAMRRERLEEFARVAGHDLRNPLNVAQGNVELARDRSDGEDLARAAAALDRIEGILDRLLSLAHAGRTVGEPVSVSLESVANEAWSNVTTDDLTLAVEADATLEADRSRLLQLFENLFGNAVEHGGDSVAVGPLDDGFYVADDGPGIPESEREAVFDAGHSLSGSTGFGLSIVETIADDHGWTIDVTESGAGGARFEVRVDASR